MRISEIPDDFKPEPVSEKVLQLKDFIEKELSGIIDFVVNNEIMVNAGMFIIKFDKETDEFAIGFHVNTDPSDAAYIAIRISAFLSTLKMKLKIFDGSMAFEFDKNGDFLHISTGEDAYETVGREPFCGDEHIANRMFFTHNGVIQGT